MKQHGVGINFGIGSQIFGINGLFQSRDHSIESQSEYVNDVGDTPVSKVYWGFIEKATFTYVYSAYVGSFNYTFNQPVPVVGNWITITDPIYPVISGNWLVDEIGTTASNTSALRVVLKISRSPFISSNTSLFDWSSVLFS